MKREFLTVVGTAITLAFTSNVAMAQSHNSSSAPTEIKMSPEGMRILCLHFPLNSRCPGGIPLDKGFSITPQTPDTGMESNAFGNNTNADTTTVPITPIESNSENSNQLTPAPLTPANNTIESSSQVVPVPGNTYFVEFSK
ncbi:MAG: hypothetical protein F6K62_18130 [Sphaerospermopsis sp. SIO1G2]|nr:hypothetical protein [Sphaerospermopsis sp. SIO1G1]NET72772.1 hypothetical protein [Sphaerospermopsis sp. SIO1G2]